MVKKFIIILGIVAFAIGSINYVTNNILKSDKSILTEVNARLIAQKTCIKGGEALDLGIFEPDTNSWLYEANLNATREGCKSYCSVHNDTKTAEVIWKCDETTETPQTPNNGEIKCRDEDREVKGCTKIYKPVCGLVEVQCIKAPCNPARETFSNSCLACSNELVKSYKEGFCNDPLP